MKVRFIFCLVIVFSSFASCYQPHPITTLPNLAKVSPRILFVAVDGIDHDLMHELKKEGHFRDYGLPIPLISTFPSSTTVGFTGLFQPLQVGPVPGYEVRFFSHKDNRIKGGTPKDIYKIPIKYKYFFDVFRHTMQEKALMYSFPGIAGRQDMTDIQEALFKKDKRLLFTYIGSTDGSAHMSGRKRTKKYLIHLSQFLSDLKRRYERERGEDLRIILFSDHGFQYNRLKTVSRGEMAQLLERHGYRISKSITSDHDVVPVRFGVISAGAFFTQKAHRAAIARLIGSIKGVDLTFWHDDSTRLVHIRSADGQEASFEYESRGHYRYLSIKRGDPLNYLSTLKRNGYHAGQYLDERTWLRLFYDHEYPDAGYRLYDAFFNLVENRAAILISLKPRYQYGALAAQLGTYTKLGQFGTHGGLFKQTTWAFAMSTDPVGSEPKYLRYDMLFEHYIPQVTAGFRSRRAKRSAPLQ